MNTSFWQTDEQQRQVHRRLTREKISAASSPKSLRQSRSGVRRPRTYPSSATHEETRGTPGDLRGPRRRRPNPNPRKSRRRGSGGR
uniref:Uncharacterized protein n=1 Tax=Arundo donax TaxID=35708 RepID=A0A0A9CIP5_ARUDO